MPQPQDDIFIARSGVISRTTKRLRTRHTSNVHARRASRYGAGGPEDPMRLAKVERVAAATRSVRMVFQPIMNLHSGEAVGVEALARFSIPPLRSTDQWFAEAAEVGLGTELEMAALCAALGELHKLPSGLYLSLNASPETMMSETFRSAVADAAGERVVLELTEHTGVDDYKRLCEAVSELRTNGVRLAVDDAGAGFSSMRHILNIQPDIIKLDVGLTRGIDRDPARRALGSALLTFGLEAFDASLIAEGIETPRELSTLQSLGYPYGQGFYLGRPMRMTEVPLPEAIRLAVHDVEAHETATEQEAPPVAVQEAWAATA